MERDWEMTKVGKDIADDTISDHYFFFPVIRLRHAV